MKILIATVLIAILAVPAFGAKFTNSRDIEVIAHAPKDVSGIVNMWFSFDNENWGKPMPHTEEKTPLTLPDEGDGIYTVHVQYQDGAGNWGESYSNTITLDTTGPGGEGGGLEFSGGIEVKVTVEIKGD